MTTADAVLAPATTEEMAQYLIFPTESQFRTAVAILAAREPVLPDDDELTLRHDAVQVRRSWTLPTDARFVVSLRVALNAVAVARAHHVRQVEPVAR